MSASGKAISSFWKEAPNLYNFGNFNILQNPNMIKHVLMYENVIQT